MQCIQVGSQCHVIIVAGFRAGNILGVVSEDGCVQNRITWIDMFYSDKKLYDTLVSELDNILFPPASL